MRALLFLFLVSLLGCSSVSTKLDEGTQESYFKMNQLDPVIQDYESLVKQSKDKDRVMYLYDLAILQHQGGYYQKSNATFRRLEQELGLETLGENVARGISSIAVGTVTRFKLEDYELLLINYYRTMNYLKLNDYQGAGVEIKKMTRVQERIKRENGNEEFGDTKFASYFSGVVNESLGKYDDALIDYRRVEKEDKLSYPFLRYDLLKMATKLQRTQLMSELSETYKIHQSYKDYLAREQTSPQSGEVVVIFQNGFAPFKDKHSEFPSIPVYKKRTSSESAQISINGEEFGRTFTVVDVENLAIKSLENHFAKHVGRAGARAVLMQAGLIASGVATMGTSILGQLAIQLIDTPDLRSIKYLPANIQMQRIFLPANQTYQFHLSFDGSTTYVDQEVFVEAGKIQYLIVRPTN